MRVTFPILAVLALSACEPTVPDSSTGVGFQDYSTYQRERILREQQLAGIAPLSPASALPAEARVDPDAPVAIGGVPQNATNAPVAIGGVPQSDAQETAAAALAALGRSDPAPAPAAPAAQVGQPLSPNFRADTQTAAPSNASGISDEQNFAAVAERETIESDAERLRRQREAFEVVAPQPLPSRSGSSGPNIVAYALSTNNAVGQSVYRRTFGSANRASRACARFATSDLAQEAFLESGGPERDRQGLDPDGDGFACNWDPTPFRAARN